VVATASSLSLATDGKDWQHGKGIADYSSIVVRAVVVGVLPRPLASSQALRAIFSARRRKRRSRRKHLAQRLNGTDFPDVWFRVS